MKQGQECIGVSVVFFCHDGHGNVVMGKRNGNCRDEHGLWDIGGGAVELHGTVENTLHSEIKQEYCTDVISYQFLGYRDVHREHNGSSTHWITLDFMVLVIPEKVKNGEPDKFEEVRWFRADHLPASVHSQLPNFLKLYANRLR